MDGRRLFQKGRCEPACPSARIPDRYKSCTMDPTSEDTAVLAAILNTAVDAIDYHR